MWEKAMIDVDPGKDAPAEVRFPIFNVSWDGYLATEAAIGKQPGVRLTFDRGNLELMRPSMAHEVWKKRLGRLLECAAEELERAYEPAGGMTLRRADLARGIEPDESYWFASHKMMQGKSTWDGAVDPMPDLVLEIEMVTSSVDRMGVYAALGIEEVWRFDGRDLRIMNLDGGSYVPGGSRVFPEVSPEMLVEVANPAGLGHPAMLDTFRKWLAKRKN